MSDFPVTIYHNPRCSTSRTALSLLQDKGYNPEIVEYLNVGWTEQTLLSLAAKSGGLKGLLRGKEPLAQELGLLKPRVREATILKAMIKHPILVERPIIDTPKGVVVARPMERINDVMDRVIV
ncbi:arsenate reductase (glutaredoxin) [Asticcacaulis sp. BYS171W]|uniref:Arsenate reductase n=1 Tax=Asticcacaulis aquaticus TaxID=2984212 RepID=A0ABT5HT02_9CAUL|nr:arsenate reductase (glutaredoxin) [Asticcacaulis aquaticus]MDC7683200.1 arsenate reductase (glutaredoxin) [Asticcacaulis aquaticus]